MHQIFEGVIKRTCNLLTSYSVLQHQNRTNNMSKMDVAVIARMTQKERKELENRTKKSGKTISEEVRSALSHYLTSSERETGLAEHRDLFAKAWCLSIVDMTEKLGAKGLVIWEDVGEVTGRSEDFAKDGEIQAEINDRVVSVTYPLSLRDMDREFFRRYLDVINYALKVLEKQETETQKAE